MTFLRCPPRVCKMSLSPVRSVGSFISCRAPSRRSSGRPSPKDTVTRLTMSSSWHPKQRWSSKGVLSGEPSEPPESANAMHAMIYWRSVCYFGESIISDISEVSYKVRIHFRPPCKDKNVSNCFKLTEIGGCSRAVACISLQGYLK